MKVSTNWLWDRKITIQKARTILKNPQDKHFLSLASLLFSRKNNPKEVFNVYIKPIDFIQNWYMIKRRMRKDAWNNPRIEYWQAIYEKLKEKYKKRNINIRKEAVFTKPQNEFCKLIVDKIRNIRRQKGLTQRALAKRLKVSQQLISRIESGRENISLLTLKNIADSLQAKLNIEIYK